MILIVGGAGYVGSHVNKLLNRAGIPTVVFDNLSRGHREFAKWGSFFFGDLSEKGQIQRCFRKYPFQAVMNFSAFADVGESITQPSKYYLNNVTNGQNLIEAMLDHGVAGIIFSSTCAIYGEPRQIPITEADPKDPINPYGRSKLAFEHLLEDCDVAYGLKSVCLRYFNAAGASEQFGEDHDPETHLIPNVLKAALGRGPGLEVFGNDYPTPDGTCVRDYVHISDLASAHEKALGLLREGRSEKFNLGNGKGFSVLEVVETAGKVAGRAIPYKISARRKGDPAVLVASSAKAEQCLGWRPRYASLESIIGSAWKWHSEHPDGYLSG